MSSAAPTELNAAVVIANIEGGAYPREMILTVARGFLPLPQEDLITVLAFLTESEDEEIASLARTSMSEIPARIVHAFAANENANPVHLALLSHASNDAVVLEALIRNRAVPDAVIVELARRAAPPVQEIIVINQARILRAPEILDALLENPHPSPDARRRALETREEFFEKKARLEALRQALPDELIDDGAPLDPIADLLEQALQQEAEGGDASATLPSRAELGDIDEQKGGSIWAALLKMTVSEKVQLAFKGDKTVRMILVRERNRLVSSAAIKNPRISENEVETIAGMRNVEEEVLRIIGNRRDWTSKYPIAAALVRNPKAPVGVVLPLINRLTLRDLKGLKDDRGVSEAVRVNARKLFQAKQKI
jgi:hypothetical protein